MKEFEAANASGELSRQHIARLTRPGATYFNLNPFDVLQLDADTPMTECKKRYRQVLVIYLTLLCNLNFYYFVHAHLVVFNSSFSSFTPIRTSTTRSWPRRRFSVSVFIYSTMICFLGVYMVNFNTLYLRLMV